MEFYANESSSQLVIQMWNTDWTISHFLNQVVNLFLDTVASNVWSHIIYTNDGNMAKVYQGGSLKHFISVNANPVLSGNVAFERMNHSGWDAHEGKLDDIGLWNRALSVCEIQRLYQSSSASSITQQPQNKTINIGSNASFTVSATANATFQWQTNTGWGFQNISNIGQYSGVTNDTLMVSNITLANNNQQFRCIVSTGSCSDTSNAAILSVLTDIKYIHSNSFSVYPNPADNFITIKVSNGYYHQFESAILQAEKCWKEKLKIQPQR